MAYSEPAAIPETVNCRNTFTGPLEVEARDLVGLGAVDLPDGERRVRPEDPAPLRVADGLGDGGVDQVGRRHRLLPDFPAEVGPGPLDPFDEEVGREVVEQVE